MYDNAETAPQLAASAAAPATRIGAAALVQTVVIVDQNPVCARLYRAMLEPFPCRVLLAGSAQEAADLVERGWTPALREGAVQDNTAALRPLILMAGLHPTELALCIAQSTGGEAIFVRKPVASDDLATLVRRHLHGLR
jgi:DNA-binding NtrC family response regulator